MTPLGRLIIALTFVVVILLGLFGASKFLFRNEITVNYENINSVTVYKSDSLDKEEPNPVKEIEYSGEVIKLASGDYTFYYEGKNGYESKYVSRTITEASVIDLKAELSEQSNQRLADKELPVIRNLLATKYPRFDLYSLREGKLYKNGEWFGGVLAYKGADTLNGDDLKFIFHKESGKWVLITDPPTVLLSKKDYADSNIPDSVIDSVNDL